MNKKEYLELKAIKRLSEICFTNERDGLHCDTFDDFDDIEDYEGEENDKKNT